MTLREKQSKFTWMVHRLIEWAYANGYNLTFGDAYRDPRATFPYGSPASFHKKRLAQDFNLFKNGRYLSSTKSHKPLGEYWEKIGGSWGGRWGDGNHYSLGE